MSPREDLARSPQAGEVGDRTSLLSSEARTWEVPLPLGAAEPASLPLRAVPQQLRAWVEAVAEEKQVSVDMVLSFSLGVLAAALRGKVEVSLPDFVEPVTAYVLVSAETGEGKSRTLNAVASPLYLAQRDLQAQAGPQRAQALAEREIAEESARRAMSKAGRTSKASDRADAESAQQHLAAVAVPAEPQLITADVTAEALGALVVEQSGHVTLMSAEAGVFETLSGRYSRGVPNLDLFLSAYTGDPFTVNRRGSPRLHVDSAFLTVVLATQPLTLAGLKPEFVGRGLVGRFLWCCPPSRRSAPRPSSPPPQVPVALTSWWSDLVRRLAITNYSTQATRRLGCSAGAAAKWRAFDGRIRPRLDPDSGDLGRHGLDDWATRLPGHAGRLAALLAIADDKDCVEVNGKAMSGAIELAEYYVSHARVVFDVMGADGTLTGARALLRWLRRTKTKRFSTRDAYQQMKGSTWVTGVEAVRLALALLEDHHCVRKSPGAARTESWEVNPTLR